MLKYFHGHIKILIFGPKNVCVKCLAYKFASYKKADLLTILENIP